MNRNISRILSAILFVVAGGAALTFLGLGHLAWSIAFGALAFCIVVGWHELFHYIPARIFNLKISAYSIGFGPEIYGWTDKRGTRWKISAIPLGGFVAMVGEEGSIKAEEAEGLAGEYTMDTVAAWKRLIIVMGGPLSNLFLAVVIIAGLNYGPVNVHHTVVQEVQTDSAAAAAGIKPGDRFVSVSGMDVRSNPNLIPVMLTVHGADTAEVVVNRDGELLTLSVRHEVVEVQRPNAAEGVMMKVGRIGVSIDIETVTENRGAVEALNAGVTKTYQFVALTVLNIYEMIFGQASTDNLGGVVTIGQAAGNSAAAGVTGFLGFLAVLNIALGVMNLLPLLPLDGGHAVIATVETITGRRIPKQLVNGMALIGVVLFIGFAIYVNGYLDLGRIFGWL